MNITTIAAASSGSQPRVIPTRDELCAVKMSFQGMRFNTPSYGNVYWWETLAWWPNKADRIAAYQAKRTVGDTHVLLDLSGRYPDAIGDYNDTGADWTQNLDGLVALAKEAIAEGFLIDLRLAGDGRSKPKNPDGTYPYNDPYGWTYGYEWLMENFPRIAEAFRPIYKYVVFVPGYDGVFYGWGEDTDGVDRQPERVMNFGKLFRSIFSDGVLGLEFSTGHVPLGESTTDYAPGGRMQDYDVLYGEFNPWNYHESSTWQIVGRLVQPYTRPADQNDGDVYPPPFYLAHPNARGPWYFIAFEILTFEWVRGKCGPEEPAAYLKYFRDMGCRYIC